MLRAAARTLTALRGAARSSLFLEVLDSSLFCYLHINRRPPVQVRQPACKMANTMLHCSSLVAPASLRQRPQRRSATHCTPRSIGARAGARVRATSAEGRTGSTNAEGAAVMEAGLTLIHFLAHLKRF